MEASFNIPGGIAATNPTKHKGQIPIPPSDKTPNDNKGSPDSDDLTSLPSNLNQSPAVPKLDTLHKLDLGAATISVALNSVSGEMTENNCLSESFPDEMHELDEEADVAGEGSDLGAANSSALLSTVIRDITENDCLSESFSDEIHELDEEDDVAGEGSDLGAANSSPLLSTVIRDITENDCLSDSFPDEMHELDEEADVAGEGSDLGAANSSPLLSTVIRDITENDCLSESFSDEIQELDEEDDVAGEGSDMEISDADGMEVSWEDRSDSTKSAMSIDLDEMDSGGADQVEPDDDLHDEPSGDGSRLIHKGQIHDPFSNFNHKGGIKADYMGRRQSQDEPAPSVVKVVSFHLAGFKQGSRNNHKAVLGVQVGNQSQNRTPLSDIKCYTSKDGITVTQSELPETHSVAGAVQFTLPGSSNNHNSVLQVQVGNQSQNRTPLSDITCKDSKDVITVTRSHLPETHSVIKVVPFHLAGFKQGSRNNHILGVQVGNQSQKRTPLSDITCNGSKVGITVTRSQLPETHSVAAEVPYTPPGFKRTLHKIPKGVLRVLSKKQNKPIQNLPSSSMNRNVGPITLGHLRRALLQVVKVVPLIMPDPPVNPFIFPESVLQALAAKQESAVVPYTPSGSESRPRKVPMAVLRVLELKEKRTKQNSSQPAAKPSPKIDFSPGQWLCVKKDGWNPYPAMFMRAVGDKLLLKKVAPKKTGYVWGLTEMVDTSEISRPIETPILRTQVGTKSAAKLLVMYFMDEEF